MNRPVVGLSRKKVWVNLGFYAVSFTLNQLSYILIVFVLFCTFWKKVRKTSAHGKGLSLRQLEQRMVKRSTGVARTVWVAKSECCQKQYYSNIGFLTWLKLLPLALCVNKFPHTRLLAIFNGAVPPLAGNYLCKGILRELYAYNGNIKEKPAPLKDTT